MFDSSKLIGNFHDAHVNLTRELRQDMHSRRDANLDRIKAGLKELDKPSTAEAINQGGNAMQTMTQQPEADSETRYDIDVGIVFEAADSLTPSTTKSWVRDAIAKKATNLKNEPEAKKKCVRVIYADGYQCDFPILKREQILGKYKYWIATGTEWLETDPKAINEWFESVVKEKSPEDSGFQLRRIARFVKYFCKVHSHRTRTKLPAGLVATALAVECYVAAAGRDDESLYATLKALSNRSQSLPVLANGGQVSGEKDKDRIKRLKDAAIDAVEALDALQNANVTDADARKAWKKVFRHSFFDEQSTKAALETKSAVSAPSIIVGISPEEKLRRAQAAAAQAAGSGAQTRPWSR